MHLIGLIPLVCAGAYLVFLLAHFPRLIADVNLNPDASWAPVLARDLVNSHRGGHILVGAASHFTTIWFLALTTWVPFRTALWDVAPFLTFLAGLGLVAWACRRIAGTWSALATIAIGVSATASVVLTVMSEGIHGHTFFVDGALAAFLVFWATRAPGQAWQGRIAVVVMIVLAGTTVASDSLFLPSGLGPLVGAAVALWVVVRDRRTARVALLAGGMAAASVVLALGVNRAMSVLGFERTFERSGYALAARPVALANLRLFTRQLLALGNASFTLHPHGGGEMVHAFMALVVAGAVVLPFALLLRSMLTTRRWAPDGPEQARFLYLAFWILSGVATCAAVSLTAFAEGPSDSSRYVAPAFFALAATVPVWAARLGWRRVVLSLGVGLFCLLSLTGRNGLFIYETVFGQNAHTAQQRPQAIAFLESQGVTEGYTGYWDSHPVTLLADMRVHFYPVIACRTPASARLCPFFVNTRTDWYAPRPGTRTFILYDASNAPIIASAPTPDLGTAAITRQFGSLTVSIYDYDVAARFARPCPVGASNQFFCAGTPE
ncbi:MAG: hypothetical protein NVSMB32_06180 [Actinomycetota bacterium]